MGMLEFRWEGDIEGWRLGVPVRDRFEGQIRFESIFEGQNEIDIK